MRRTYEFEAANFRQVNFMNDISQIKWDLFIRAFHWSLVACFALAWFSGEFSVDDLHSWFGYAIALLVAARLIWGVIGRGNARFTSFIYSPAETLSYLSAIIRNNPKHYASHNPAGALMVFALLAVLALMGRSGCVYEAWGEYEGPLWMLQVPIGDELGRLARTIHKMLPEILLVMVGLHLLGVVVATIQHKENFVRAMWYGREK